MSLRHRHGARTVDNERRQLSMRNRNKSAGGALRGRLGVRRPVAVLLVTVLLSLKQCT